MPAQYDNNMSGALFKNDKKTTDKHPDYRGACEIDNTEYWVSAWIKKSKDGKPYMSLAFTEKEEQPTERNPPAREPVKQSREKQRGGTGFDDMDDDIPF